MKVQLQQPNSIDNFIAYASFDVNPETNKRALAINSEELKQELDSLFSTKKYERPYLPDYYNPLEELIGELWSEQTKALAYHLIVDKINQFVPRITVDNNTDMTYDNYTVQMSLVFYYNNDFTKTLYNYKRIFDIVT